MFRNLIFRLRAAWIFSAIQPHISGAPRWSVKDATILSNFLSRTDTGKKYRKLLWYHVQVSAFKATLERDRTQYECGYAAGCRGLCAVADALLQTPEPEEQAEPLKSDDPLFKATPEVRAELERLQP